MILSFALFTKSVRRLSWADNLEMASFIASSSENPSPRTVTTQLAKVVLVARLVQTKLNCMSLVCIFLIPPSTTCLLTKLISGFMAMVLTSAVSTPLSVMAGKNLLLSIFAVLSLNWQLPTGSAKAISIPCAKIVA